MQYFSQETGISGGVEREGCYQRESIKVARDDETRESKQRYRPTKLQLGESDRTTCITRPDFSSQHFNSYGPFEFD